MLEVASLALARHLELFPGSAAEIWDRTDPRKPVRRDAGLVFTTATGAPVHPAWWAKIWPCGCALLQFVNYR